MAGLCLPEAVQKYNVMFPEAVKGKPRTSVLFVFLSVPSLKARKTLSMHCFLRAHGFLDGDVRDRENDDVPYGPQTHYFLVKQVPGSDHCLFGKQWVPSVSTKIAQRCNHVLMSRWQCPRKSPSSVSFPQDSMSSCMQR